MAHHLSVLIVDDEKSREQLKKFLEENFSFEVKQAADGYQAIDLVQDVQNHFDVALIDARLNPDDNGSVDLSSALEAAQDEMVDGIQVMQKIKDLLPEIECIIYTGWAESETGRRALQAGAFRYIEKSMNKHELALLIRMAALQTRLRSVSRAILANPNLEIVLEQILGATCALTLADDAAIVLRETDPERWSIYHHLSASERDWRFHLKGSSLTREIFEQGKNEVILDITSDERVDPRLAASGYHSLSGLPIPGDGTNLGVLYIYSRKEDHFSDPGSRTVVKTLASQAGLAVTNIRSFQKTERHANYMEALVKAGQGMASANEEQELFSLAWDFVRDYLQVATFYIALFDQYHQVIRFPFYIDDGVPQKRREHSLKDPQVANSISAHIVRTGTELLWDTPAARQQSCAEAGIIPLAIGRSSASCIFVPLKIGNEVIGFMSIQSYRPHAFSPFLKDAFRALSSQLSVSLKKIWSFAEVKNRSQKLTEFQEHILNLNLPFSNLRDTLEATCKAVCTIFQVDHSGFVLFNPDRKTGKVEAEYPRKTLTGTMIPLAGVPVEEELITQKQAIVIEDIASSEALGPVREILMDSNIYSCVFVPVMDKNTNVTGSFSLDSIGKKRHFDDFEVRLFAIFAAHATVAIQKAQAMEELRSTNHELTFMLDISKDLTSTDQLHTGLKSLTDDLVEKLRPEKASFAVMFLLNREENALYVRAASPIGRTAGFHWKPEIGKKVFRLADLPNSIQGFMTRQESVILLRKYPEEREFLDLLSNALDLMSTDQSENEALVQGIIQSAIAVPLCLDQEPLGILSLCEVRDRPEFTFTNRSLRLADAIGLQASVLIDRLKKLGATRRRLEDMHNLRETLQQMIGRVTDQPKETLKIITDAAVQILCADSAIIYPFRPGKISYDVDSITATGMLNTKREYKDKERDNLHSMTTLVVQRQIIIVDDVSSGKDRTGEIPVYKNPAKPKLMEEEQINAFVGIALQISGRAYGVLFVNHRRAHIFSREEEEIIRIFADQAGAAVQKSRLFHKLRSNLSTIGETIAQTSNLIESMRCIVLGLRDVLDCDIVTSYYFENLDPLILMPCGWDGELEYPQDMKTGVMLTQSKVFQKLLEYQKPYYAEDAPNDPVMGEGDFVDREKIASSVGVTITAKERPVGMLFANYHDKHQFNKTEQEVIETFASMTAVALENTRLFQDQKQLLDEVSEQKEIFSGLHKASAVAANAVPLDEVLMEIAKRAYKLTGKMGEHAAFCQIFLKEGNLLLFKVAYPKEYVEKLWNHAWEVLDLQAGRSIGIVGRAAIEGKSKLLMDVTGNPDYIDLDQDTRSELVVPIQYAGEVIGVINVEHPAPDNFDTGDLKTLEYLAAQAALSIHNAQMIDALQKSNSDLKQIKGLVGGKSALEWMSMVTNHLRHSINGQVGICKVSVEMVRRALESGDHNRTDQKLEDLVNNINRLIEYPIVDPLSAEEEYTSLAINHALQKYLNNLWKLHPYLETQLDLSGLQADLDQQVTVRASEGWLRRGLEIVVNNAVRAMLEINSFRKYVAVRTQLVGESVEIRIRDTGPGIPDAIYRVLFHEPLQKEQGSHGSGLGLLLAKTIFEAFRGSVTIPEHGPQGTEVLIVLPIEKPATLL